MLLSITSFPRQICSGLYALYIFSKNGTWLGVSTGLHAVRKAYLRDVEACSVMVETGRRVLFLTGAPLSNSLTWKEEELSDSLQPCFAEFYQRPNQLTLSTEDAVPSWRSLPLHQAHLPTGLTQASRQDCYSESYDGSDKETSFLSTSDLSFVDASQSQASLSSGSEREILSQYYEHSFALHEDIPSSQIVGAGTNTEDTSFMTEPEEFSVALSANDSEIDFVHHMVRSRLASGHISDLRDMPNAGYLNSINPQTMTVNLVVGIISTSQPRTIKTRRGGRVVELVELLLGDDTRAGFGVNIWLRPSQESQHSGPQEDDLRNGTMQLRPRDIVLLKQVALSSFRGKVYGQSLRRGMTTLDLLHRTVADKEDRRGAFRAIDLNEGSINDLQLLKVKRVMDWVMQFVGASASMPGVEQGFKPHLKKSKRLEALPNDTP